MHRSARRGVCVLITTRVQGLVPGEEVLLADVTPEEAAALLGLPELDEAAREVLELTQSSPLALRLLAGAPSAELLAALKAQASAAQG